MNAKSGRKGAGTKGFSWPHGLYVACPLSLALLFGLNLALPPSWAVGAFYSVAIVAAIPTWDRRFIRELSLAAVLFVLWNVAANHEGGVELATLLLNCVIGLLVGPRLVAVTAPLGVTLRMTRSAASSQIGGSLPSSTRISR